jgi:ATP/maltotriose-dependent transcriptional regulator MalT
LYRVDSQGLDYYRRFAAISSRIGAFHIMGDQKRFLSELRATLQEARDTENVGAQLQMTLNQTVAEEIEGQTELAFARLDRQRGELPKLHFGTLHVLHLSAVMTAASSTGEFDWAEAYLRDVWPAYEQSMIRKNATLAFLVHTCRARMLLNRHAIQRGSDDPANLVHEDDRAISKFLLPSAKAQQMHLRGRVALLRGDKTQAIALLQQSADAFAAAERPCDAMRERYALGILIGGAEGEAMRAGAEQQLRASGYTDPTRTTQAFYPELLGWR